MAGIWPHIVATNWRQHAGTALTAAQSWLADGFTYLTTLPRDCVLATAHATMVCTWAPPEYTIPGFGPLAVGWGWLLLGVLQGALLTLLFMFCTGRVRGPAFAQPRLAQVAAQIPAPAPDSTETPDDVLLYLASGGRSALQDMAARAGMTETQLLHRVFSVQLPIARPAPAQNNAMQQDRMPARRPAGTSFLI